MISIVPKVRQKAQIIFLLLRLIAYGGYYWHGTGGVATYYDGWLFTSAVGRAIFFGICRFSLFRESQVLSPKRSTLLYFRFFIIDILPCTSFLFIRYKHKYPDYQASLIFLNLYNVSKK